MNRDRGNRPDRKKALEFIASLNKPQPMENEAGISLLYDIVTKVEGINVYSKDGGFVDNLSRPTGSVSRDNVKGYSRVMLDGDIMSYAGLPKGSGTIVDGKEVEEDKEPKVKEDELVPM